MPEVAPEVRDRLCLALDVDDLVAAQRLASQLRHWFGVAKVGLELYSAAGPDAITTVAELGFDVFVDLKLHDIPNTVGRACQVLGALGARYVTLHAAGGPEMLRAGVTGLAAGAVAAALRPPVALAVSVLTSDDTAPAHVLTERVRLAAEAGCGGVVCAVDEVAEVKRLAPRLVAVTPAIRPAESAPGDQRRIATPQQAFAAGSDLLVVGRAVTASNEPAAAAAAIAESLRASP